jgi:hypothetical protein
MMKGKPAESPDAYVASLDGWRAQLVTSLRRAVRGVAGLEEEIKWGHLVYSHGGPVLLIRAETERVLFGFWRGKLLRELEPRLKAGGKYEMATLELREGATLKSTEVRRLVRQALKLNQELGDPRGAAKQKPASRMKAKSSTAAKTPRRRR